MTLAATVPNATIRQLLPAPAGLVLVPLTLGPAGEGSLVPVLALALIDHEDPAQLPLIVPVILDDGLLLPVIGGLAEAFLGCYPLREAERLFEDLGAEFLREQAALHAAASDTLNPVKAAKARAIIAAAQART